MLHAVSLVACREVQLQALPEALPVVQLRLAPPKRPYPEVSAEIGSLELDRERAEAALKQHLRSAYDAALTSAKARINTLVSAAAPPCAAGRRAVAFLRRGETIVRRGSAGGGGGLAASDEAFAVQVTVFPHHVPDASIRTAIDQIEAKRARLEERLFQQAEAEMAALTSLVVDELGRILSSHAGDAQPRNRPAPSIPRLSLLGQGYRRSRQNQGGTSRIAFLQRAQQRLPAQANIRIMAADVGFPRIADLVEDMERRRDRAEDSERSHILQLELLLLKEVDEAIEAALVGFACA